MPWGLIVIVFFFISLSLLINAAKKEGELVKERAEDEEKEARQKWIDEHTNHDAEKECRDRISGSMVPCQCPVTDVQTAIESVGCNVSDRIEWMKWKWFIIEYGSIYLLAEEGLIPYRMVVGLFRIGENGKNEKTAAEIYVLKSINKKLKEKGYSSLMYKPIGPAVEYLVKYAGEQDIAEVDPWEYRNVSGLVYPREARPPYLKT